VTPIEGRPKRIPRLTQCRDFLKAGVSVKMKLRVVPIIE
jgi:hypothetical protein